MCRGKSLFTTGAKADLLPRKEKPVSEFILHQYTSRAYTAAESIDLGDVRHSLSDLDEEMQYHTGAKHIQISNPSQEQFEHFVLRYADRYDTIYFFHGRRIRDLSALSGLKNVRCLLFYSCGAQKLWDMRSNLSLRGLFISDSKRLIYDLQPLVNAPALEEVIQLLSMYSKYTVKSVEPLMACTTLKRAALEFNTENRDFDPSVFGNLEALDYQVDRKRN